jgi:hypothetical protein
MGSAMIPGVLVIIEDVVAVDGGGGQDFRQALLERYEASEDFRSLLWQMNWFWGGGATVVAVVVTLIVFLVNNTNVVFALGELFVLLLSSSNCVNWSISKTLRR